MNATTRPRTRTFRARAALIGLLAILGALAAGAASASAGEWVQVSCENPDGVAAGSQGWSTMAAGGGYGSNAISSCGPGSPAAAFLSSAVAVPVGSAETLLYTPPVGSTLIGGQVSVGFSATGGGYDASGTAVAYTPELAYNGSNVFFQCASGLTACSPAGASFRGTLTLPSGRGGRLFLSAGCGGDPGGSCDERAEEGTWSLVRLYGARLRLANDATPAAEKLAGSLLAGQDRGTEDLTLTALDPSGPGVLDVSVTADGQTLYSATPDSNGGACVPVGSEGGALMFDGSQPCRESEALDLALDTTGLRDGTHVLKVTVTDAAGNRAVVYDAPVSTLNAPVSLAEPGLQSGPGGQLDASPGAWQVPAGAGTLALSYQWQTCEADGQGCRAIPGASEASYTPSASQQGLVLRALVTASDADGQSTSASPTSSPISSPVPDLPNGLPASEHAALTLLGARQLTRTYAHRALSLRGQLLGAGGAPIAGATIELLSRSDAQASEVPLGYASTGADGTFTASIPPGPSRVITAAYRAFSADSGYAVSASMRELVRGSVTLHVTPTRIHATGTIALRGQVAGPLPPAGVSVELLVRYRGRWEPFRSPRTGPDGRFRVRYRFEGATGRFPFKALVLSGQSGFPYAGGESAAAIVSSR